MIVAAVRSGRGASRVLLTAALERKYTLLASVPLMLEYESVLNRHEHLLAAQISTEDVEVLLDALAVVVDPVESGVLERLLDRPVNLVKLPLNLRHAD